MKERELIELVFDELNQGTISLEVNGLDLYLHVYRLRVRLKKCLAYQVVNLCARPSFGSS